MSIVYPIKYSPYYRLQIQIILQSNIIMETQQHHYNNQHNSLSQLSVFSRLSSQQPHKNKKPTIRKISHSKQPRNNIQPQYVTPSSRTIKDKTFAYNECSTQKDSRKPPQKNNFHDPLQQVYNQQIVMLREEIERLREVISIMERNHHHQIQFYSRDSYIVLLSLKELMEAKQYQRTEKYIEAQLSHLIKRLGDKVYELEKGIKPLMTKDISVESTIQEDPRFKMLVSNISDNIRDIGIQKIDVLPQIKKLVSQKQLSIKKLSWYFEQVPFQIKEKQSSTCLAKQLISQLKYETGNQIVNLIQKNIQKMALSPQLKKSEVATNLKSQISEIIAHQRVQH